MNKKIMGNRKPSRKELFEYTETHLEMNGSKTMNLLISNFRFLIGKRSKDQFCMAFLQSITETRHL